MTTTEISTRFRTVAGAFTVRADAVPLTLWNAPAPCDGWTARDIVRHMTEWMPAMLRSATTLELPDIASVDDDPAHAWRVLSHGLQSILDVPFMANGTFAHQQAGTHRIADAIDMFMTGDILVHTWDLARAVGLDERLDAVEVHRMYEGLLPLDAMLRTSGHYGPRVVVSDTADEQTKLIAFTGRRP